MNLPVFFFFCLIALPLIAHVRQWSPTALFAVPTLHRGTFNDATVGNVLDQLDLSAQEGFVVRVSDAFSEADMPTHMAKYVRADHVQSDKHWMHAEIIRNGLQR